MRSSSAPAWAGCWPHAHYRISIPPSPCSNATLRSLELKKAPSVAETIDWARTVLALGIEDLDESAIAATLGVVLKHNSDHLRAAKELGLP